MFVPYTTAPKKTIAVNSHKRKYPRRILALATRKRCLWRQYCRDRSNQHLSDRYKEAAREYTAAVYSHEVSLEQQVIEVEHFTKVINRKLGRKHNIGVIQSENGEHCVTNSSKAEALNSYFTPAYTRDHDDDPIFQRRVPDDVNIQCVPKK